MAEDKPEIKKAAVKKSAVKKATTKTAAPKKAASPKKTVEKKPAVKKAPVKKSTGPKAAIETKDTYPSSRRAADKEILATIKSIVNEMRLESDSRDKQMTLLVKEIQQGFSHYAEHTNEQVSAQDREMNKLQASLQNAFSNAEDSNKNTEERSLLILKSLSESIMKDHEQTLLEVQQQGELQDKKIQHLTQLHEQRSGRNRWIAIPGTIIAVIAIIYMFYVVSIMEEAMTNMSGNMDSMQASVGNMSEKMNTMAEDTHLMQGGVSNMNTIMGGMAADTKIMSTDMNRLNKNLTQMSYDLNIMTRNVSPTMKGIHDMMPWSP